MIEQFPDSMQDDDSEEENVGVIRRNSAFDLLGEYSPYAKVIFIYTLMCKIVADAIGIDPQVLKRVVHAHERAHFVTHRGIDETGYEWQNFLQADTYDQELFAQIYALLYLKSKHDTVAVDAFYKLADHQ